MDFIIKFCARVRGLYRNNTDRMSIYKQSDSYYIGLHMSRATQQWLPAAIQKQKTSSCSAI